MYLDGVVVAALGVVAGALVHQHVVIGSWGAGLFFFQKRRKMGIEGELI